ncbi:MAG: PH domain-containing protein [Dehalococcoidia bacterium]
MDVATPMRPAPRERLDPRARTVRRLHVLIGWAVALVVGTAIAVLLGWRDAGPVLVALPVVLALLGGAAALLILPELLVRHWRYELSEQEIDLQRGIVTVTRTLIPMARIQHVDTRRGVIQRRFGLATVVRYTAAGASEIPDLAEATAGGLRDRIATLANTADDL